MEARMTAATSPPEWTYADYVRLPDDGNRYEVLDGEVLTTPSPGTTHQRVARALFRCLDEYVSVHGIGEVLWELDVLFAAGQFLCPDIVYIPNGERHRLTERGVEGRPGLLVEVVSPGSRRIDFVRKPARYGELGFPEYWVADAESRTIHVWQFGAGATDARVEKERVAWQPEPAIPPLQLDVRAVFEGAGPARQQGPQ
jgi:Uma2 family endonuclease